MVHTIIQVGLQDKNKLFQPYFQSSFLVGAVMSQFTQCVSEIAVFRVGEPCMLANGNFTYCLQTYISRWNKQRPNLQSNKKSLFPCILACFHRSVVDEPSSKSRTAAYKWVRSCCWRLLDLGVRRELQRIAESFFFFLKKLLNSI